MRLHTIARKSTHGRVYAYVKNHYIMMQVPATSNTTVQKTHTVVRK